MILDVASISDYSPLVGMVQREVHFNQEPKEFQEIFALSTSIQSYPWTRLLQTILTGQGSWFCLCTFAYTNHEELFRFYGTLKGAILL